MVDTITITGTIITMDMTTIEMPGYRRTIGVGSSRSSRIYWPRTIPSPPATAHASIDLELWR